MNVIQNKGTQAQQECSLRQCWNGHCHSIRSIPIEGFEKAKESLLSGKAFEP